MKTEVRTTAQAEGTVQAEGFRLSPQQKRLWMQQSDGRQLGWAQLRILIEGGLDTAALGVAIDRVADRHEILRTTFQRLPGLTIPVQVIASTHEPRFQCWDLKDLSPREQEARVEAIVASQQAEDWRAALAEGPTLTASVVTLAPARHLLLIILPALCADSATLRIVMREITREYAACVGAAPGPESSATGEVIQYADIAEWQNELVEGAEGEAGRAFWNSLQIPDARVLVLPFEGPSPEGPGLEPQVVRRRLASNQVQRIERVARENGTSTSNVLLTCWHMLLSRLAGQPDMLVGAASSGRKYEELGEVPGLLGKYLPLVSHLEPQTRFTDALAQIHDRSAQIEDRHESFTWEAIARAKGNGEDLLFFPFCFEFEERPPAMNVAGASFSVQEQYSCIDRFTTKLSCVASGETLDLLFHYDARHYGALDIERLAEYFVTLLESALANPAAAIGDLEVLGGTERRELLVTFNETNADFPAGLCIHQLMEEQAAQAPDRCAVRFEGEELTYADLNARANQLARYLRRLGVGPEVLVGIAIDRSPEALIGIFGILKAGGAYVPLDPKYPRERLAFMLADTQAPVLVTRGHLVDELPAHRATVVCLDQDWEAISQESEANLVTETVPENIAYVIYTSGSTGNPKGVLITHRSLVNSTCARFRYFREPAARFLLLASFSFDSSVAGIFWPLCQGGTLILPRPGVAQDPMLIADAISKNGITHLTVLASLYEALLTQARAQDLQSLKVAYVGGEVCPPSLPATHRDTLPGAALYNAYGPTENTVWTSVSRVDGLPGGQRVPIGGPIANAEIYLLDDHLLPVPAGVPGEVHIGGTGLARGYLNQPALTAERFIPSPFEKAAGARLYKTGDLARHRPDGQLEFLGRTDNQVKIRGFRIELGEIEALLDQHPAVREAAVVATDDEAGDHPAGERAHKRLVAYVASANGGAREDRPLYTLPNGLEVACFDQTEARDLYKMIFEERNYLKHGITLNDGDCVFDVGANIGMFALFAHQMCSNVDLYAFEPLPPTFDKCRANMALYGLNARLFDCGLSDSTKTVTGTFYRHRSAMSGVYADRAADEAVTRAAVENQQQMLAEHADELIERRLESETFPCRLRPLSDVIAEHHVERIDLLKIDVEKSELDVLNGIDDADWARIHQIVIEVHDIEGRLAYITALLRRRGYEVVGEQDPWLAATNLHNIYAVRPSGAARDRTVAPARTLIKVMPTVKDLRSFLQERLPEYMVPAAFVVLDKLPRLPNGKVDRHALPALDQGRPDLEQTFVAPRTPTEELLARIWVELLRVERVGVHDNFFELGGDSILSIQVVAKANQAGLRLSPMQLFEHQTVAKLAQVAGAGPSVVAEQGKVEGEVALTPIQQWFFEQDRPDPHHYNMPMLLEVREPIDVSDFQQAVRALLDHHDALRLRFVRTETGWRQFHAEADEVVPVTRIDLSDVPEAMQQARVEQGAAEAQASLDLEHGPLMRVVLFERGAGRPARLLWVLHHLVGDGVSWGILLQDLQSALTQIKQGAPIQLPPKTTSFKQWSESLAQYAQSSAIQRELDYWLSLPWAEVSPLPVDIAGGANTDASTRRVSVALNVEETRALLQEVPKAYNTQVNDVLLTALSQAFSRWTNSPSLLVDLEGHGREDIGADVDLLRTVGWYTTAFPVVLPLDRTANVTDTLTTVKEELRRIPNRGIGHGLLRYSASSGARDKVRALAHPEVSFNYMGQFDQVLASSSMFAMVQEPIGPDRSPRGERAQLVEIFGWVLGGCLQVEWLYSANVHHRATIEGLAHSFVVNLQSIIAHCLSPDAGGYTASDFTEFQWNQSDLNAIVAGIQKTREGA